MIVDIPGSDALRVPFVHQGCWIGTEQCLDRPLGDNVPFRRPLRDDIEQSDRHAGVCKVRRNSGAHNSGADHRNLFNRAHCTASRIVAMPWPPPIHWVDKA